MKTMMSLKVVAIFEMLISSFLGIIIPLYRKDAAETFVLRLAKACSAGVMLALSVMHLLPEASEILSEHYPDYPVAYALLIAGVVLVLGIEQLTLAWTSQAAAYTLSLNKDRPRIKTDKDDGVYGDECGLVKCSNHDHSHSPSHDHVHLGGDGELSPDNNYHNRFHDHGHDHSHIDQHGSQDRGVEMAAIRKRTGSSGSETMDKLHMKADTVSIIVSQETSTNEAEDHDIMEILLKSNSIKDIVSCYLMELSVAVHSIIIGIDMGLIGDGDTVTMISLMIALSFHQFLEGFGLGTTIQSAKYSLGNAKILGFVFIFSISMSAGIVIGILIGLGNSEASATQEITQACADSIAAGSLLYISLAEMTSSYFAASDLVQQPMLRATMVLSYALGASFMAILAIWA